MKYNFRKKSNDVKVFDTAIIKIYLSEGNLDDWVEIGLYDFDNYKNKSIRLEKTLNIRLLGRRISYFNYDEDEEIFSIFLENEGRGEYCNEQLVGKW